MIILRRKTYSLLRDVSDTVGLTTSDPKQIEANRKFNGGMYWKKAKAPIFNG